MDELLGGLIWLFWLPYELWRWATGESRIGASEMDRAAGRSWKRVAFWTMAITILIAAVIAWKIFGGFL